MNGIQSSKLDSKARTLTVVFDLGSAQSSSSGKTTMLASTGGFQIADTSAKLPLHRVLYEDGSAMGAEGKESEVMFSASVTVPIENKARKRQIIEDAMQAKADKAEEEEMIKAAKERGRAKAAAQHAAVQGLGALPQA